MAAQIAAQRRAEEEAAAEQKRVEEAETALATAKADAAKPPRVSVQDLATSFGKKPAAGRRGNTVGRINTAALDMLIAKDQRDENEHIAASLAAAKNRITCSIRFWPSIATRSPLTTPQRRSQLAKRFDQSESSANV